MFVRVCERERQERYIYIERERERGTRLKDRARLRKSGTFLRQKIYVMGLYCRCVCMRNRSCEFGVFMVFLL